MRETERCREYSKRGREKEKDRWMEKKKSGTYICEKEWKEKSLVWKKRAMERKNKKEKDEKERYLFKERRKKDIEIERERVKGRDSRPRTTNANLIKFDRRCICSNLIISCLWSSPQEGETKLRVKSPFFEIKHQSIGTVLF